MHQENIFKIKIVTLAIEDLILNQKMTPYLEI
jgi:hypothetical protein